MLECNLMNTPVCNGFHCEKVHSIQCNNVLQEKCWDEPREKCWDEPHQVWENIPKLIFNDVQKENVWMNNQIPPLFKNVPRLTFLSADLCPVKFARIFLNNIQTWFTAKVLQ